MRDGINSPGQNPRASMVALPIAHCAEKISVGPSIIRILYLPVRLLSELHLLF